MGVTFFEQMSGELTDDAGQPHRVVIDIRCDASRVAGFARTGRAAVTGTIRALPWVDAVAVTGTIEIRPLVGRRIAYDLSFEDGDGAGWVLTGRKLLTNRHPVRSATELHTVLEREGEVRARGRLYFQMDDIVSFLRSWHLGPTVRPARDAAGPESLIAAAPLNPRQLRTLGAFADTIITPGGAVPPVDAETRRSAERLVARLPGHIQLAIRAGLLSLNASARGRHGRQFADLSRARRTRIVERLRRTTAGDPLVLAMGLPIKMAHFGRRDYLSAIGVPEQPILARPPTDRWLASVTTPEELPTNSVIECDVAIIGTGAGGAAAAAALAEHGHAVVMLEEGRYFNRSDFDSDPADRMLSMWRDAGLNLSIGNSPVGVPVGRTVGGSTTINSGIAIRTPDPVLGEWLAAGFPGEFEPQAFRPYLDRVEQELGIAPGRPEQLGAIAGVVARGAEQLGLRHGALPRNSPDCDAQGQCVFGCPTDAKRSANVSWVPRALRAGAGLFTGLPVTRILLRGERAVGVVVEGQDRNGAPRRVEVRSRVVLVAAGALHTPLLLRRNGINLPMLGRNLSIHPALGMLARLPESGTQPWRAIPMGYFADSRADDLVKFEGFYAPAQLAAATMPFDGPELTGWMADWARIAQFGFMVRDTGVGRVTAGPGGRPLIRYSLTPRVLAAFHRGSAELTELLLLGGATQVETRIAGIGSVSDRYRARAIADANRPARDFRSMGFHPLGTARMGSSGSDAVVDFDHRVFGTQNLYVVDGSAVPTSLGVNPQVTIMAMALRAADVIDEHLGRGNPVSPASRSARESGAAPAQV